MDEVRDDVFVWLRAACVVCSTECIWYVGDCADGVVSARRRALRPLCLNVYET